MVLTTTEQYSIKAIQFSTIFNRKQTEECVIVICTKSERWHDRDLKIIYGYNGTAVVPHLALTSGTVNNWEHNKKLHKLHCSNNIRK